MNRLDPRAVKWLVVHTVAHAGDASAAEIRRWHVNGNGWADIGYHWVIRKDGRLETGRSLERQGAHVAGINSRSIGVCCSGHGDREPFTPAQVNTLIQLAVRLHLAYGIQPDDMIGHREVNRLIDSGIVERRYRTDKTCPGTRVDMHDLRERFRAAIPPRPEPKIVTLPPVVAAPLHEED